MFSKVIVICADLKKSTIEKADALIISPVFLLVIVKLFISPCVQFIISRTSKSFAAGFSLTDSLFISKIPVCPASNFSEYSLNFLIESISSGADSLPVIF